MLLSIENLSAGYVKNIMILNDFNMQLDSGSRVGIIGQNGTGKSTLAKAVMGLLPYTKGSILYQGKSLKNIPVNKKNDMGIAYFMQGGRIFGHLSVKENLKIALNNKKYSTFGRELAKLNVNELPLFAEERRMQMLAENLSGGEKHILGFVMTVLSCPEMKLLIADEPSAGLAQVSQNKILSMLKVFLMENNVALLLIEQNRNFLNELTNNILELKIE